MRDKYKNALMWALYAVLFLLTVAMQTVVFGRARYFGAKLSLMPVLVACVAMLCGAENGGAFGLAVGTAWCLAGADGAGLTLMLLTVSAVLCGWRATSSSEPRSCSPCSRSRSSPCRSSC